MILNIRVLKSVLLAFTVCVVAGILCIGCKGEGGATGPKGPDGPPGPPGPNLTGSIRGFVYLRKEDGSFESSRKDVIAQIEGTTIADTSDNTGSWKLDSVSSGSYTITFSKTGYSTMKYPGTQFVGNGEYYLYPTLLQASGFNVTTLTQFRAPTSIVFNGTISSISHDFRLVYIFFSRANTVSSTDYKLLSVVMMNGDTTRFADTLSRAALIAAGFPTGTTFHMAAYGMDFDYPALRDLYSYIEPSTGLRSYPGLSSIPRFFSASVP